MADHHYLKNHSVYTTFKSCIFRLLVYNLRRKLIQGNEICVFFTTISNKSLSKCRRVPRGCNVMVFVTSYNVTITLATKLTCSFQSLGYLHWSIKKVASIVDVGYAFFDFLWTWKRKLNDFEVDNFMWEVFLESLLIFRSCISSRNDSLNFK